MGFKKGHKINIGRVRSIETREKMAIAKTGDKNPMWKGDLVGYWGIHMWARKNLTRPEKCERCGINSPKDRANKSQQYLRDVSDWEWLCRSCHIKKDRIEELDITRRLAIPK